MNPHDLIRTYGPLVSSLARQFFGNAEQARDAVQDAWEAILEALPGFEGRSAPSTWIHTVAWRRMLRFKKAERRHRVEELHEQYLQRPIASQVPSSPDVRLWVEEVCLRCMTGVLFCLNSRQRLAYLLRESAGLPYAEVATILSTSEANARQLLSRAKAVLAQFLSHRCDHARPQAVCAYGMTPYIRTVALDQTFDRLRNFASRVEAFRLIPQALPGPNYWEAYLFTPHEDSCHKVP